MFIVKSFIIFILLKKIDLRVHPLPEPMLMLMSEHWINIHTKALLKNDAISFVQVTAHVFRFHHILRLFQDPIQDFQLRQSTKYPDEEKAKKFDKLQIKRD